MSITLKPGRWLANAKVLTLCLASLIGIAIFGQTSAQQPQSGIDPCSRAIARLATPSAQETLDPSANRIAVSQTVMNFTSCFNRHAWEGVLLLTNDDFRESMFGIRDAGELRIHLDELDARGVLPEMRIHSIEENGTTGSTLATLVVTWQGWSGLHQELWRLQVERGNWVLAGRSIQSPQVNGVAVGIRFEIEDDALRSPAAQVANPGTIVLAFENGRAQDARVLVLEVGAEATIGDVVTACNRTGQIGYKPAGMLKIPAGETVSMPMFELADGIYAVIAGEHPCAGDRPVSADEVQFLGTESVTAG